MKNILAIDIGNTNITLGFFACGKMVKKLKTPTFAYSLYKKAVKSCLSYGSGCCDRDVEVVVSSVVPLALSRLVVELNKNFKCRIVILGRHKKVPIKNLYRIKTEVGQDRLVNAFAAKTLYGQPSIIIDLGTAITFDIVSVKGEYLGGLIMPGIEMSLNSLYCKTALLPKVELKPVTSIIGRNTADSMRGGILFGLGSMCDGLVARYKKMLGRNARVIATGGNASLIKRYTSTIDIIDDDLTLKGMNLL